MDRKLKMIVIWPLGLWWIVRRDAYIDKEAWMLDKMIKAAQEVFDYGPSVWQVYERESQHILSQMDTSMMALESIRQLLGGNSMNIMQVNHENHINFMLNVIKYKQSELLVHTLPWVYKTYCSKGLQPAYFEYELKQWQAAIESCIGGHDKKVLLKIYDLMLAWHPEMVKLSQTPGPHLYGSPLAWTDMHEALLNDLLKGNHKGVMQVAQGFINQEFSVIDFYLNYLQPVMYKIGEYWADDKISVGHEHLATSTIARVMSTLYPAYILGETSKGLAIVTAGLNEYHQIGARMVADALEADGWDIRYLGADIALAGLIALVEELKPDFVALSMTMAYHVDDLVKTVAVLKEKFGHDGLKVMVGGIAINAEPSLQEIIKADAYPVNAKESVTLGRLWFEGVGVHG